MTTHRVIASSETDPFAPIVAALMKALALNPVAIAEGATGAPYVATGWHPYNGVNVGDAATGIIYDFAVHGAVANVVSPDFEDGYEYLFIGVGIDSSVAVNTFLMDVYRETTGAYIAAASKSYASTLAVDLAFRVPALSPMVASTRFFFDETTMDGGVSVSPSQRLLRARFRFDFGNIAGGTIRMLRRLAF